MWSCRFPVLAAVWSTTALLAMDPPPKDHKAMAGVTLGAASAAAPAATYEEVHDASLAKHMEVLEGLDLSAAATYTNETGAPLAFVLEEVEDNHQGMVVALVDHAAVKPVLLSTAGKRTVWLANGKSMHFAVAAKTGEKLVSKTFAIALKGAKWGSLHLRVDDEDELTMDIS